MKYQSLEVERDRLYLNDPGKYSVHGLIPAGFSLEADLDGKGTKLSWENREPRNAAERLKDSELVEGMRVEACVSLPENLKPYKKLTIYAVKENEKLLWHQVKVRELLKQRGKPQFFIEEERVDRKSRIVSISGWAAGDGHVSIKLFDQDKKPIECRVQRMSRVDVKSIYQECQIEEDCGFYVELDHIPGNYLYLVMSTRKGKNAVYRVGLSVSRAFQGKALKYGKKGMDYFRVHGVRALMRKGMNKLSQMENKAVDYGSWLPKHLPSPGELKKQQKTEFALSPAISVAVHLRQTRMKNLVQLVDSLKGQTYRNWELCIVYHKDLDKDILKYLARLEKEEKRIRGILAEDSLSPAKCLNKAIWNSEGEYIAFCGEEDVLTAHALFSCVEALNEKPDTEVMYSDEDRISIFGDRYQKPHFKPDFNLDLLCTTNYIAHLFVVKKTLLAKAGMFREEFGEAMDYDLIFRCVEQAKEICHIPKILYHWRLREDYGDERLPKEQEANLDGMRAVQAHFDRLHIPARVFEGEYPGLYRTQYLWEEKPLVSILIPNKDHIEDLERCISSIEEKSTYKNLEYVIIENNSTEERTFTYYKELEKNNPRVRMVYWDGPFNYSAINNFGASFAKGEYYLLLNNDTEVISPNWIEELIGYCMRPDVGIVGARLFYDDDTVQHAGVILGFGSIAGHCFVQQPRSNSGYQHRIISAQNYSAVTAACMMVDKKVFEEVGGLSEELAVAFNDIDFCLKVGAAGYRIVYNPYVELYHYESKSRGLEDTPEKLARFQKEIETLESRWPEAFAKTDPYYNPNLTLRSQDFSLKRI